MGFLNRILSRPAPSPTAGPPRIALTVLGGHETLEVVGESYYQDHLWRLAGGVRTDRTRCAVQALLVPEPDNVHDSNAVCVVIDDGVVGYLSCEDAAVYRPGLLLLMRKHGGPIALEGQIVGGGQRSNGLGMLGVFLDHDPADFGLHARQIAHIGELRTGLSQAVATDLEDDTYDLCWYDQLSGSRTPTDIVTLRKLLVEERDPIDRHFLSAYIAEHRRADRADPIPYLDEVQGADHAELTALIDHFLATAERRPFDAAAFEAFRAEPEVVEMSERILDAEAETLVELRRQAGVSKQAVGEMLAHDLGLEGNQGEAKACYHDIETGAMSPQRVRARVWETLAAAFGETVASVREAAVGAFGSPRLGGTFARTDSVPASPGVPPEPRPAQTDAEQRVHDAFFEPE